MSWLGDLILAGVSVLGNAVPVPLRRKLNFSGDFAVADNPAQQRTDVALAGGVAGLGGATASATPGTLMKRSGSGSSNRGGTSVDDILRVGELRVDHDVTETRQQVMHAARPVAGTGQWTYSGEVSWLNAILAGRLTIPLALPNGSTLDQVAVYVVGANGHGALPATPLSIEVRKFSPDDGNLDVGTTVDDPSPSVGAFEVLHTVVADDLGEVIDNESYRYSVLVTAESGTGAMTGATVVATAATWTRTAGSTLAQD